MIGISVLLFVILLLMGLPIAYAIMATAVFGMYFVPNVGVITVVQKM